MNILSDEDKQWLVKAFASESYKLLESTDVRHRAVEAGLRSAQLRLDGLEERVTKLERRVG